MRSIKMIGLAAVAAVAATAFIGTSSASATMLCTVGTEDPCGAANLLGAPMAFSGELLEGAAKFVSGFITVSCLESRIAGEITNAGGGAGVAVKGEFKSATFTTCNNSCAVGTTTAAGKFFTWPFSLLWTSGHNGEIRVERAGVEYVIVNAGICIATCIYKVEGQSEAGKIVFKGENPGMLDFNQVKLTKQAGSSAACSGTATWSGKYKITSTPTVQWVTNG